MSHGFQFRPGTHDEEMFNYIMANDEYHLPDAFGANDIVVDIGVHIGTFCYKALERGAGQLFGFEADRSNFECARRNLAAFGGRVELAHAAVWRSDKAVEELPFTFSQDKANTGGGTVVWDWSVAGAAVPVVAFDTVVQKVTGNGRGRIRFLKLDCETSEFPILLTSQTLHLVDEIAGEFHEVGGCFDDKVLQDHVRVEGYERFTIDELTKALTRAGFTVSATRQGESFMGLFHAVRSAGSVPRPKFQRKGLMQTWESLTKRLRAPEGSTFRRGRSEK
jgi:FkbM family methyltransferase